MISLSYDLHIHSCLSPCGDDDMTPANIVGMAAILGLDAVAVTDHNSCKNCPAVLAAAKEYGILAIPAWRSIPRRRSMPYASFRTWTRLWTLTLMCMTA